jgi:thiol-disulfide isomerase/thioredoxin
MDAPKTTRHTLLFFLILLLFLNWRIHSHHRVLPLFQAALILNTAAGMWFLYNAFRPSVNARAYPVLGPFIVILLLVLNSLVFMAVYTSFQQIKSPFRTLYGPAPSLEWEGLDGSKHTSKDLSGHVTVVHFWATWCGPCQREFPQLLTFAKAHPDVNVLAVDVKDIREKANRVLAGFTGKNEKIPPNVLIAWDPEGAITYEKYNVENLPSSVFVDPKGQLRRKYVGPVEWSGDSVRDFVRQWPAAK